MDLKSTRNPGALPQVVFYTRAGCHLCDEAKVQLLLLQQRISFQIEFVDIDKDPELQARYNHEVPVIFVHGKKAFKYRLDEAQFLRKLQAG